MLAPVVCLEWVGDRNVSWLFNACLLKWPYPHSLTLLLSERPKLYAIFAFLRAVGFVNAVGLT